MTAPSAARPDAAQTGTPSSRVPLFIPTPFAQQRVLFSAQC